MSLGPIEFNNSKATFTNTLVVSGTTDALPCDFETGAFIVAGGGSIIKNFNVGGDTCLSGELSAAGVVNFGSDFYVDGSLYIDNINTNSLSANSLSAISLSASNITSEFLYVSGENINLNDIKNWVIDNFNTSFASLSGSLNSVINAFNASQTFTGISMPRTSYTIKFTDSDTYRQTTPLCTYSSGTGGVTIQEDGWYEIQGYVNWVLTGTPYENTNNHVTWNVRIAVNGSITGYQSSIQDHTTGAGGDTCRIQKLTAGQVITLVFFHETPYSFGLSNAGLSIKKLNSWS